MHTILRGVDSDGIENGEMGKVPGNVRCLSHNWLRCISLNCVSPQRQNIGG